MIGGSIALSQGVGLVGSGPRPYSLTIDGMDVGVDPAGAYGVQVESIQTTEAGPGGVSSMHFTIWDTNGSVAIGDGAEIRLHDNVRDLPVFGGFLEQWSSSPAFGGTGRIIDVSAFGYEALLDLIIDPAFDIGATASAVAGAGADYFREYSALQALCANAPLRSFAAGALDTISNQAQPIGTVNKLLAGNGPPLSWGGVPPPVVMAGQSIRQAFETYLGAAFAQFPPPPIALTVDPWRGVRLFAWSGGFVGIPTDYDSMEIGAGVSVYATNIQYEEDHSPGAIINAVFVAMPNAPTLSGWIVGDTTTGRREAYTTTNGTTEDDKRAASAAILNSSGSVAGRGSLDLENFTPINVHPGSKLIVTDANMGWTAVEFFISEISKTFNHNGNQNWHMSFFGGGGTPVAGHPSGARLLRTLTRGTAA